MEVAPKVVGVQEQKHPTAGLIANPRRLLLADRPRQRNLLLVGLGGVGMMGLSFAQAMFKQPITVADLSAAARETARGNPLIIPAEMGLIEYEPHRDELLRTSATYK